MNLFKLSIVTLTAAAFVVSCNKSPSTSNTTTTIANSTAVNRIENFPAVNRTTDPTAANKAVQNLAARKSGELATAVDDLESPFADLYKENCMICHKDTGKGGKITLEGKSINPIDLTSARVKARSDDKLLGEIKEGVPDEGMPSFNGKLSDDEIKAIVSHIRTLK
jgi:mono/diheme cytochrome c family protein